jgi:hypothetical protein
MATNNPDDDGAQERALKKKFDREKFEWLENLAADDALPASAFKVAWVISQHFNYRTRESFPGVDTIAMSPGTVINMGRRLQARGHLEIEPGRQGRGHSHRYRLPRKAQWPKISKKVTGAAKAPGSMDEKSQPAVSKPQPAVGKPQPAEKNLFSNPLNITGGAPSAAPSDMDLDIGYVTTDVTNVTAGFQKLLKKYPPARSGTEPKHAPRTSLRSTLASRWIICSTSCTSNARGEAAKACRS